MKLLKSSDLLITTIGGLLQKKLLTILIVVLLSGGVNQSTASDELSVFTVTITKEGSGKLTRMQVYSKDINTAKDEVTLNGWKVLKIEAVLPPVKKVEDIPQSEITADGDLTRSLDDNKQDNQQNPGNEKDGDIKKTDYEFFNTEKYKILTKFYYPSGTDVPELSELNKEALAELNKNSFYYIVGHTDTIAVTPGSDFNNNQELSENRAVYLKNMLVSLGISPEHIKTIGLGSLYPESQEIVNQGKRINRRSVIYEQR